MINNHPSSGTLDILFVGGGSIGHIAPAVAVAHFLHERNSSYSMHFLVSPRPEEKIFVTRHGFSCSSIAAPRLSLTFLWKFFSAYRAAHVLLTSKRPRVVFSKGGYVSVPVCLAASRLKIPIVLHESDAVSGRANTFIARFADAVCLGFPGSEVKSPKTRVTGNPVRSDVTSGSRDDGLGITGLAGVRPILLVLGGSQGALAINEAIAEHLDELLRICDIIHITGEGKKTVRRSREGYWQTTFAYEELPHLYALADLAVSRAGANTIADLAANGIPAILIPLRGVAHDHQEANALCAVQSGGCRLLEQKKMNGELVPMVHALLEPKEQARMSHAIRSLHVPDATRQIAELIAGYLA